MKLRVLVALVSLCVIGLNPATLQADVDLLEGPSPGTSNFVGYAPDKILVKFSDASVNEFDQATLAIGTTGHPVIDRIGERHGVVLIHQQFPGANATTYGGREVDLSGWHKVHFAGPTDVEAVAESYKSLPEVEDAQP